MRAVQDDRQPPRPDLDVEPLHAPGQARGGAGLGVEKPSADRVADCARTSADALSAELIEGGVGERDVGFIDRRRGVETRAPHRRAKFVGLGLQDAPGFVFGAERGDERRRLS